MKKFLGLALAALLMVSIVGCGESGEDAAAESASPDAGLAPSETPVNKNLPGQNAPANVGSAGQQQAAEKPPGY